MKRLVLVAFLLLVFFIFNAVSSFAGQIYGSIINAPNCNFQIVCPGIQPINGVTDARGSYAIFINSVGRCSFNIFVNGQWRYQDVFSHQQPVRYDFLYDPASGQFRRR